MKTPYIKQESAEGFERPNLNDAKYLNTLSTIIHAYNVKSGWWHDINTGEPRNRNVGEMLMLVVSEVAEAMEGHRKALMDDKLPNRPMFEVELADALIRIFDLAGAAGIDLGGAFVEKWEFNQTREDHTRAARLEVNGKKY